MRAEPDRAAAKSTKPLIEIARAETKAEAMEGLERWKARHPDVWPLLEPRDVLVDSMRGRSSTWTRIRLNLEHVPEDAAPAAGAARGRLRPLGRVPALRATGSRAGVGEPGAALSAGRDCLSERRRPGRVPR